VKTTELYLRPDQNTLLVVAVVINRTRIRAQMKTAPRTLLNVALRVNQVKASKAN
jgi:hypothetical protein